MNHYDSDPPLCALSADQLAFIAALHGESSAERQDRQMRQMAGTNTSAPPGCQARQPIRFPGGPVDTAAMRASHNGPTPTTMSNAKLTRPAETYPGEAERMIEEWTRLAIAATQRARDATTGPRLVSELEDAMYSIQEALRWAKP